MATQTKPVTYDDYRTLPDDGNQYQIIEGELNMSPSPNSLHQVILGKLFTLTNDYVEKNNLGTMILAPLDVVLSMTDVVQPDLMYISSGREDIIAENNIVEAPDLVVEILSPATKTMDRTNKKSLYQRYGAKEYWIVDPLAQTIEQFILQEEKFELNDSLNSSEVLTSSAIEGFTLPVGKVFPSQ
jgi:Uma2 family endonuclease